MGAKFRTFQIYIQKEGIHAMNIVIFLLVGWILSWFQFDRIFIKGVQELFNKEITKASYYLVFFVIGALGDIAFLFSGNYYNMF